MTDKQKEKIKEKIRKIRQTLIAEKRRFGGFDDSRGLRYLPTGLFVKLGDFEGGLKYLKWFRKNFPDDIGFPEFLFESTLIYFKTGNLSKAEDHALKTYFSNAFLFDKYFNRELNSINKKTSADSETVPYVENFSYRHDQDDLLDFTQWLNIFTQSDRFIKTKEEFDYIQKLLETEPVGQRRTILVERLFKLY